MRLTGKSPAYRSPRSTKIPQTGNGYDRDWLDCRSLSIVLSTLSKESDADHWTKIGSIAKQRKRGKWNGSCLQAFHHRKPMVEGTVWVNRISSVPIIMPREKSYSHINLCGNTALNCRFYLRAVFGFAAPRALRLAVCCLTVPGPGDITVRIFSSNF